MTITNEQWDSHVRGRRKALLGCSSFLTITVLYIQHLKRVEAEAKLKKALDSLRVV